MPDSSFTPEELAKILRVSKLTIYDLIKKGDLPAYRVGRQMRVDLADLERYKAKSKSSVSESGAAIIEPLAQTASSPFTLVISGQDLALDMLARDLEKRLPQYRFLRSYDGSMNGLHCLYHRRCHIASVHLLDGATGVYNLPYVHHLLPGQPAIVVNLLQRMEGLYTAPGNPKGIHTWADLTRGDVQFVNRERGSGARVLLDEKLREHQISPRDVQGYDNETNSHMAVAEEVARGKADVGLGIEAAAQLFNLNFVPLQKEQYDLVFLKEDLETNAAVKMALQMVQSDEFRETLRALGHDVDRTGTIIGEV